MSDDRGDAGKAKLPTVVGPDPGVEGEIDKDRYVGDTPLTHWYTPWGRALARIAELVAERLGPYATLILTIVIGAGIALLLSIAAVQVYDAVSDDDGVAGLDRPMLDWGLTLRSPVADSLVTGYTDIAGTIGMPIIAVVAILILAIHRRS